MLWVLDLDGVVWLAGNPIRGSPEAVRQLHDAGERMAFVTNNSGPTRVRVRGTAGPSRMSRSTPTSCSPPPRRPRRCSTRGSRAAVVGDPGIKEALDGRGVAIVGCARAPRCRRRRAQRASSTSPNWRPRPRAIRDGARFVATNTDATFPTPHGLEPGAGAVVAYLEVGSGRKAEVAGKPNQPAADLLRARFGPAGLVVGDRPDTDGLFAQLIGAPFALVLSGRDPAPRTCRCRPIRLWSSRTWPRWWRASSESEASPESDARHRA